MILVFGLYFISITKPLMAAYKHGYICFKMVVGSRSIFKLYAPLKPLPQLDECRSEFIHNIHNGLRQWIQFT